MGLRGRDGIILRPGYRTAMRSIELPMPVLFDQHVMRLGHYKRAFPPTRLNVLPRGHIMPSVKRAITVHGGGRGFRRKFHPGPGQHVNPGRKAQVTRAARRRGHDRTRQTTRQSTLNALKVRARARRGLLEEWNYVESTAQGLSPAAVNRLRARVGALSRAMTGRCDDDWKAEKPAAAVMKAQRAAAKRILEYRRRGASSSIERGIMAEAAAAFDDDDDGAGGGGGGGRR